MTTLQKFIQDTINDETLEDKSENEKELKNQLKEKEQIVIREYPEKILFLDGEWGIGKSYYVKNILETKLALDKNYVPIKISLFGVKSIDELKDKLLNEYIKERNEKIAKIFKGWWCFILCLISVLYIIANYWMNEFCDISTARFSYIFSLFTNQCNKNIVGYIKVFGDFLNYFHFIPEIYLWLVFLSKIPVTKTKNIISYIDHKYFGTNIALQKVAINKLFSPKRYILIFDDIERVSIENIQELIGFINDLRENKGFNIIVIGNEKQLKDKNTWEKSYEKIEFQKIEFHYTKKRYENLKKYCLKQSIFTNKDKIKLSKKIDQYIANSISASPATIGGTLINVNNLRILKNLIMTIINFEEIVARKEKINKDETKIQIGISKILTIYLHKIFKISDIPSTFLPFSDKDRNNIPDFIPEIKEEYVEKALK